MFIQTLYPLFETSPKLIWPELKQNRYVKSQEGTNTVGTRYTP